MLADAFKYPLTDDEYPKTLLIGSILTIGSVLILPLFVLLGFFVKAIGNANNGAAPPRFENYGVLFVNGVKLTVVGLVYAIGFVVFAGFVSLVGSINEMAGTVGFLLLVPVYFGLFFLMTSILYQFCLRGRMRDAFDLRAVVDTAFNLRYLLVVLLWLIVFPTLFAIGQVLLAVTIIGILVIPATLVYELLVYAKLIGDISGTTEVTDAIPGSEGIEPAG